MAIPVKKEKIDEEEEEIIEKYLEYCYLFPEKKEEKIKKLRNQLKLLDLISMILLFSGLILMGIEENDYNTELQFTIEHQYAKLAYPVYVIIYRDQNENNYDQLIRIVVCSFTLMFDIIIIRRTRLYLIYLKLTEEVEISATLKSSGLLTQLLIEIIYNSLVSWPLVNHNFELYKDIYTYNMSLDQFFFLLQLGRVYILWRIWGIFSHFNTQKTKEIWFILVKIIYQIRFLLLLSNLCNSMGGMSFSLKAQFKEHPLMVVAVYFSITIFFLGLSLTIAERSFDYFEPQLHWDIYWNGIWMNIIIISTVGYGDYYPRTHLGRMYACITCVFGPFLNSLINVTIHYTTSLTGNEFYAYSRIKSIEKAIRMRNLASDSIKLAFKQWQIMNLKVDSRNKILEYNRVAMAFRSCLLKFTKNREKYQANEFVYPITDIIPQLGDHIEEYNQMFLKGFKEIDQKINLRFVNINKNQTEIQSRLEKIRENFEKLQKALKIELPINELKLLSYQTPEKTYSFLHFQDKINKMIETQMINSNIKSSESMRSFEKATSMKEISFFKTPSSARSSKIMNNIFGFQEIVFQLQKKQHKTIHNAEDDNCIKSFKKSATKKKSSPRGLDRLDIKNLNIIEEKEEMIKSNNLAINNDIDIKTEVNRRPSYLTVNNTDREGDKLRQSCDSNKHKSSNELMMDSASRRDFLDSPIFFLASSSKDIPKRKSANSDNDKSLLKKKQQFIVKINELEETEHEAKENQ